ncbi:ABC transporter substrate-binding protein [Arthrobacter sp. StoSoilB5]|uniref:ABC transporter substrate-binding protein n=1 Tax=Arthrobacter sp. StoSoilB5 TaxID=2830992 RepID=UPI001CC81E84|nr:ABC transporter substrate-binding protein [Arthrobacter sp. StoSoilB5]BCW44733.1 ABC transporter substrate-binding protein [Arthrobacter sp. StoSoilB5]
MRPSALRTRDLVIVTALAAALLTGCANPQVSGSANTGAAEAVIPAVQKDDSLAALVPDKYKTAGEVRVATNAPFPPYEMFTSPGSEELIGLEIDLGHAIGEKLGIPFKFSQQPFDGLITGLQADKYDLLMATLFDTAEREQQLDFLNYARSGSAIMVKSENTEIATIDDLCGKTVAVQNGGTQAELAKSQSRKCQAAGNAAVDVKGFPAFSDEQLALNSGGVTAILGDLPALAYGATGNQSLKILSDPAAPGGYDANYIGIGFSKDDDQLLEAVKGALTSLQKDGVYKQIFDKYGVPQSTIEAPLTNQFGG